MRWQVWLLGAALCTATGLADDGADRANIAGIWELQTGGAKDPGERAGESWILETKEDAVHITRIDDGHKLAEFECNTLGRECEVKDSGHSAKVTFWFNGPKLVQLETRGSRTVKRRFSTVDQGNAMDVEEIPMSPEGKTVVRRFTRVQRVTARQ